MFSLQSCFEKFHGAIAINEGRDSRLRLKRDILLKNLRAGLFRNFLKKPPRFEPINQGSYILGTGVKPLDGEDYDIDVGVIFDVSKNNYDPTVVKSWVFEALNSLPRTLDDKFSCVRVQYHEDQEKEFHVDLAVYCKETPGLPSGQGLYLAKGRIFLNDQNDEFWEPSEPQKLKKLILQKSRGPDGAQFLRVIQYLKRWKDWNFVAGDGRPTGIAITACAYQLFQPYKNSSISQSLGTYYIPDDLRALTKLVFNILDIFSLWDSVEIELPVEPYNNLFAKMNTGQMVDFRLQLEKLRDALITAWLDKDLVGACDTLRVVFGDEFPSLRRYAKK